MAKRSKGNCYQTASHYFIEHHYKGTDGGLLLVHGRPKMTNPPFDRMGHAWLECDDFCIDTESKVVLPRFLYYLLGHINESENYYYTFEQMRECLLRYQHYGPWDGEEKVGPIQTGEKPRKEKQS